MFKVVHKIQYSSIKVCKLNLITQITQLHLLTGENFHTFWFYPTCDYLLQEFTWFSKVLKVHCKENMENEERKRVIFLLQHNKTVMTVFEQRTGLTNKRTKQF